MRRKECWSVIRVFGTLGNLQFQHGGNYFIDLYAQDVGKGAKIVVLRDGKSFDKGETIACPKLEGGVLFSGLEKIIPYYVELKTDYSGKQIRGRLERVSQSPLSYLKTHWFLSGDVIRVQISSQKLRIALDRPF